ncbi:hypothetical protein BJY00DRAFT_282308 [Aspergillus carlsbadensis]|nr:hypothetical protein BJY00DRAFT_282308 [Aspergillus carlsbadensis]
MISSGRELATTASMTAVVTTTSSSPDRDETEQPYVRSSDFSVAALSTFSVAGYKVGSFISRARRYLYHSVD